jgi:hypothetical protein
LFFDVTAGAFEGTGTIQVPLADRTGENVHMPFEPIAQDYLFG